MSAAHHCPCGLTSYLYSKSWGQWMPAPSASSGLWPSVWVSVHSTHPCFLGERPQGRYRPRVPKRGPQVGRL